MVHVRDRTPYLRKIVWLAGFGLMAFPLGTFALFGGYDAPVVALILAVPLGFGGVATNPFAAVGLSVVRRLLLSIGLILWVFSAFKSRGISEGFGLLFIAFGGSGMLLMLMSSIRRRSRASSAEPPNQPLPRSGKAGR